MSDRSEMTTGEAEAWRDCQAQAIAYLRDFARSLRAGRAPSEAATLETAAEAFGRFKPKREPTGLEVRGG